MAAGNAVIGALRAVLGIDTAQFETGLKAATTSLASFGFSSAKAAAAMGAAISGAAGLIGVGIQKTINDMDTLGKSSQKLGIPVEQLSGLAYAADLADISFEQLSKGVVKLSKNMVEAVGKPAGDAARAFAALGVKVTDVNGKMKSSDVLMADLADAFKGFEDDASKTAVAMAIFGKAGADMIPMLNEGGAKMRQMAEEAKQFGAVVSGDAAKQAEEFNDNITRLGYAFKGVFVQVATQVLPTLVNFSNKMVEWAKNSGFFKGLVDALVTGFNGFRIAIQFTADNMSKLMTYIGLFIAAQLAAKVVSMAIAFAKFAAAIRLSAIAMGAFNLARKAGMTGIFLMVGGIAMLTGQMDKLVGTVKGMTDAIKAALPDDLGDIAKSLLQGLDLDVKSLNTELDKLSKENEKGAAAQKKLNFALAAGAAATKTYLEGIDKSNVAKRNELATNNMSAYSQEYLRVQYEATAAATAKGGKVTAELALEINKTAHEAGILALQLSNLQLIGTGTFSNFTQISLAIETTNQKLLEGGLKTEDYARMTEQSLALTKKLWMDSATSIGESIESIGSSLSNMNSDWARAAKVGQAIGAAIAFVNAYIAASEALASATFPANIAIAAGVLAKGLAMVAAIKGAAMPAHAKGGAFKVPGGVGGGDKVPFSAMLEPGELVEISSNRSDGYKAGGSRQLSGTRTVYISAGLRQIAEALIPELNAAMRDGHELKLASM